LEGGADRFESRLQVGELLIHHSERLGLFRQQGPLAAELRERKRGDGDRTLNRLRQVQGEGAGSGKGHFIYLEANLGSVYSPAWRVTRPAGGSPHHAVDHGCWSAD
jgi:hypothetical protein